MDYSCYSFNIFAFANSPLNCFYKPRPTEFSIFFALNFVSSGSSLKRGSSFKTKRFPDNILSIVFLSKIYVFSVWNMLEATWFRWRARCPSESTYFPRSFIFDKNLSVRIVSFGEYRPVKIPLPSLQLLFLKLSKDFAPLEFL